MAKKENVRQMGGPGRGGRQMLQKGALKTLNMGTVKRLLSYLSAYKAKLVLVFICILVATLANVASSLFLQTLIDDYVMPLVGTIAPDFSALFRALMIMCVVYLVGIVSVLFYNRTMAVISQGTLKIIRDEMFRHMHFCKHFVLSTTERKLKAENRVFLYIIIIMAIVAVGVAVYVYRLRKRKREVERKLAEIEEANQLRPEPVATAMKQVETEFYQSEYYQTLRHRIEAGENLRQQDWKELEHQLKVIYPNFSNSLYGLYNFSPTEYQVCMLLKIRTKPIEIATVLNRDKSTISTLRSRLYKKVFGKDGSGKDWDEFILSL